MTWSDFLNTPIAPLTFLVLSIIIILILIDHQPGKYPKPNNTRASKDRLTYECPGIWPGEDIDGCSGGHGPERPMATRSSHTSQEPLVIRTRPTRKAESDYGWLVDQPDEMPIAVPDWPVRVVKK
jgi:hypothetical protein